MPEDRYETPEERAAHTMTFKANFLESRPIEFPSYAIERSQDDGRMYVQYRAHRMEISQCHYDRAAEIISGMKHDLTHKILSTVKDSASINISFRLVEIDDGSHVIYRLLADVSHFAGITAAQSRFERPRVEYVDRPVVREVVREVVRVVPEPIPVESQPFTHILGGFARKFWQAVKSTADEVVYDGPRG